VREPREALEAARRAAAAAPNIEPAGAPWRLEHAVATKKQLVEWAIIEPDPSVVYSTRRFGRPITTLKHLLIRLLFQYVGQISAQQSRFNAHVAARLLALEERVRRLEEATPDASTSSAESASGPRGGDDSR
jgi:hypothetical protein